VIIKSVVNRRERTYLLVYNDDVEGQVLALSPALIHHGVRCAQKYGLEIPDRPTYQRLEAEIANLHRDHTILRNLNAQLETQLIDQQFTLGEITRQRDGFAQSLRRTTHRLWKVQDAFENMPLLQRLLWVITGHTKWLEEIPEELDES